LPLLRGDRHGDAGSGRRSPPGLRRGLPRVLPAVGHRGTLGRGGWRLRGAVAGGRRVGAGGTFRRPDADTRGNGYLALAVATRAAGGSWAPLDPDLSVISTQVRRPRCIEERSCAT